MSVVIYRSAKEFDRVARIAYWGCNECDIYPEQCRDRRERTAGRKTEINPESLRVLSGQAGVHRVLIGDYAEALASTVDFGTLLARIIPIVTANMAVEFFWLTKRSARMLEFRNWLGGLWPVNLAAGLRSSQATLNIDSEAAAKLPHGFLLIE